MKLPGAAQADCDPRKLRDYLLSETHPVGRFKARFFLRLGYTDERWELLRTDLLRLAQSGDAERVEPSPHGEKYLVRGRLEGPTGASAPVVTVWILSGAGEPPRLVTAYPDTSS